MSTLFGDRWQLTKKALCDGLSGKLKQDMGKVFDYILKETKKAEQIKILLPVARRVYPTMKERISPKKFTNQFLNHINFSYDDVPVLAEDIAFSSGLIQEVKKDKGNSEIDLEAELMAVLAVRITEIFDKK